MYSKDLIDRAVKYTESGHTFDEMRAVFAISVRAYYEGKQRLESGYYERKKELQEIVSASPKKVKILFLPPYSPDFNPIENSWANLKRKLCDLIPLYKSVDIAIYNYFFAYLS